jgi:glycosyltransferase involved in cell wall biosynthesis
MDVEGECGMIDINFHRRPRRWRGYVRQFLERTLLRFGPWKRVHTIDPLVFTWVKQRGGKLSERFHLLPEPVEEFPRISKESARRSLGIPQEGRYIGSAGVHTMPYKGTQLLVEAFSRAELLPTDRLLIAGPLGDNLMHRLNTEFAQLYHSGRIVVVDKYLTEVDLMTSLAAMDLVCTPYSDHLGSSAIVIRAAQAGRPVLAPHAGWFAEIIPPFQLGDTGPILEITTLAAELKTALERSERFRVSLGCERLIEYSKSDNFARLWASRLRERIGLPLDKDLRTWEWVLQALPES